jgi:hypothetical protein
MLQTTSQEVPRYNLGPLSETSPCPSVFPWKIRTVTQCNWWLTQISNSHSWKIGHNSFSLSLFILILALHHWLPLLNLTWLVKLLPHSHMASSGPASKSPAYRMEALQGQLTPHLPSPFLEERISHWGEPSFHLIYNFLYSIILCTYKNFPCFVCVTSF